MYILNVLTSQCLVTDIRRAAALARLLSGWPAASTACRSSSYYTQYDCDTQEQVDTKND